MKKILIVLAALFTHALADEEAKRDPFTPKTEGQAKRPQRLAPSEEGLKSFKELSLKGPAPADTTDIRSIYVPTCGKPFSIRVTKARDKVTLKVVRMSGEGGYEWGKIDLQKSLVITDQQWASLIALATVDGAREPSQKANKEIKENFADVMSGALDGATWYLEMRDKNGYTVEGVPNPRGEADPDFAIYLKKNGLDLKPFIDVCIYLFDLSGLKEPKESIFLE
jgi:hypothetical protein